MSNARNLGNITTGGATGATTASVTTSINNLIDAAPGALNTLNELAAALGDDANFSTTVTNSIATKLPLTGGTLTGDLTISSGTSGDATLTIEADTDNNNEFDNPKILFKQDGGYEAGGLRMSNNNTILWNGISDAYALPGSGGGGISFYTGSVSGQDNATLKMHIKTDGKVGINTNDPQSKLHVNDGDVRIVGDGQTSGGACLQINNTNTSNNYPKAIEAFMNSMGVGKAHQILIGKDGSTNDTGSLAFYYAGNASASNRLQLGLWGSGSTLNILGSGNVGIGTTDPGQLLEVNGSGATIRVESTDNNQQGIEFYQNNTKNASIMWGQGSANLEIKNFRNDQHADNLYANIDFFTGGSNATSPNYSPNLVMRLTDDGNVGIGTTTPGDKLVVHGDGARMTVESADYEVAMLGRRGSSGSALDSGYLRLRKVGVTADGVVLDTNGSSWLNGGNVGIGTASPGARLHVLNDSGAPAVNTNDTDPLVTLGTADGIHGGIDLHATQKASTLRSTVYRLTSSDNYGFGYNAYNMGTINIGRVDQGYTWNGTNGNGEYTGGVAQQPRYMRKAHFSGQILANNTYYTIAENMSESRFTIECFCGDASSRDYKKYVGYYTSTAYGVYGLTQVIHMNGGWNSGSFDMRVSAPNGNLSIDLRFNSYYNSSNIASWMCIYTGFV